MLSVNGRKFYSRELAHPAEPSIPYHEHFQHVRDQRKAKKAYLLSACHERRNRRIAKVLERVEHVFAAVTQWNGKKIRTIGQARAAFAMEMMVVVYNMRRLAFLGA